MSWLSLTHWGRVTHICVSKLTIIASDNGLSPGRRQAIIWNNGGILSIGLLGSNFSEIWIKILTFSFKKNAFENIVCQVASTSSRPQWVKEFLLHIHITWPPTPTWWFHLLTSTLPSLSFCHKYMITNRQLPPYIHRNSLWSGANFSDDFYHISNKMEYLYICYTIPVYLDGLLKDIRNFSRLAMELRSCTNPLISSLQILTHGMTAHF